MSDPKFFRFVPVVLLLSVTGILVAAPDSAFLGSNTTAPSPVAAKVKGQGQKIDLPIPVGEPVKGIKIPQYDENGKLTMNLIAETARKLDEKQVEFGKLKIEFNEKEEKTIIVEIPHSILDMESKVLVADTETTIRREDFEIIGQGAEFDTLARSGTFKGRVHASFRNGETANLP
ncbi:MAG: LPS export ABC transporter periplasmic protein LptC [Verrucomicrobia bacterium]|nr:LPS export ABC transporter periplasmic protein LptC [Verrucomicrobiota bacterium]